MIRLKNLSLEKKLQIEKKKSRAPITGFLIACALKTEKGIYLGHNLEKENSHLFIHAEKNALDKALKKEKHPLILGVYLVGGGKIIKIKNYTPCKNCVDTLKNYVSKNTSVHLFPLRKGSVSWDTSFNKIAKSYKKLAYSRLVYSKIKTELKSKTLLNELDRKLVANLAKVIKKLKGSLYLTGSASGRGGVSSLIMKEFNRSYNDIDLVTVIKKEHVKEFELSLDEEIKKLYKTFSKKKKPVPPHKNKKGVVIKNLIYFLPENGKLDLTIATNIDGALRQPPYELGNWFHQIL